MTSWLPYKPANLTRQQLERPVRLHSILRNINFKNRKLSYSTRNSTSPLHSKANSSQHAETFNYKQKYRDFCSHNLLVIFIQQQANTHVGKGPSWLVSKTAKVAIRFWNSISEFSRNRKQSCYLLGSSTQKPLFKEGNAMVGEWGFILSSHDCHQYSQHI